MLLHAVAHHEVLDCRQAMQAKDGVGAWGISPAALVQDSEQPPLTPPNLLQMLGAIGVGHSERRASSEARAEGN